MPGLPAGTVTLFFTDIEGSTQLARRYGGRYEELLADQRRLVRSAVAAHGGAEVDTQGDAFFVAFERAHDAVLAAVDVQHAIGEYATATGVPLRVRIGVHTGEPRLSDEGYYVGVDLSRAARICAAAHGDQILLSASTRDLVGAEVRVLDLGEHLLKDIDAPERLFQVVAPGLRERFPPPRARAPGNLPRARTTFHGRGRELDEIQALLEGEPPVVTLTGPGGVGKTRLALEGARRARAAFRDGTFFVSFAGAAEPDVPALLAQALEVEEQGSEPLPSTLRRRLGESEALLVLDNFEAVAGAVAEVAAIVDACPNVKVLATSREPLHLRTEREYRVEPLDDDEAAALFVARAAGTRGGPVAVSAQDPAVPAICRRLEGLPLALELAAARTRVLPLAAVLERLDERLGFLTDGAADLPERQRTLAATIEWSYTMLDEEEQAMFLALAVFAGGASLEAAEHVAHSAARALDTLTSLCDKSLLVPRPAPDGSPRFRMLETIREYALGRLREAGAEPEARRRHAEFALLVAERAAPELEGPGQARTLRGLALEHENLRGALQWAAAEGEHETLLRISAALWRFWFLRGHLSEGRRWLAEAVSHDLPPNLSLARALFGASALAVAAGDAATARRHAARRLDVCRAVGDDSDIASALGALANATVADGDASAAAALYEEASVHARRAGDRPALAGVMNNLGYLRLLADDPAAAREPCSDAAALFDELERVADAAGAWLNLAIAQVLLGRTDEAGAALGSSLDRALELEHLDGVSYCLDVAAAIALRGGDARAAAVLAGAATALRERTAGALPPVEQRLHDRTAAELEERLDTSARARALREGTALDLEAAVAAARSTCSAARA